MINTNYTSQDITGYLGSNGTLDADEHESVFKLISQDGVIDNKDIEKLKAAGVTDVQIKALLIEYYGANDKNIIQSLIDGSTSVTLTDNDLGNEDTPDDRINSVFK